MFWTWVWPPPPFLQCLKKCGSGRGGHPDDNDYNVGKTLVDYNDNDNYKTLVDASNLGGIDVNENDDCNGDDDDEDDNDYNGDDNEYSWW